jgi:hypothetical protein
MSKLGKRLIAAADEALAIARGGADPATHNVHVPADVDVTSRFPRDGLNGGDTIADSGLRPAAAGPFAVTYASSRRAG